MAVKAPVLFAGRQNFQSSLLRCRVKRCLYRALLLLKFCYFCPIECEYFTDTSPCGLFPCGLFCLRSTFLWIIIFSCLWITIFWGIYSFWNYNTTCTLWDYTFETFGGYISTKTPLLMICAFGLEQWTVKKKRLWTWKGFTNNWKALSCNSRNLEICAVHS